MIYLEHQARRNSGCRWFRVKGCAAHSLGRGIFRADAARTLAQVELAGSVRIAGLPIIVFLISSPDFRTELENLSVDGKGKGMSHEAENTDAPPRVALLNSSEEAE